MIYKILEIINREGFVTVQELSRRLDLDEITIKSIVKLLESRNLLKMSEKYDTGYKTEIAARCQFCPLKGACHR